MKECYLYVQNIQLLKFPEGHKTRIYLPTIKQLFQL
jgi:hypothetical protein